MATMEMPRCVEAVGKQPRMGLGKHPFAGCGCTLCEQIRELRAIQADIIEAAKLQGRPQ